MAKQTGSDRFELNKEDMWKVGKGLLVAAGGAALTYIAEVVTQVDFGSWTPVVVAGASVLVNLGRKWIANQKL